MSKMVVRIIKSQTGLTVQSAYALDGAVRQESQVLPLDATHEQVSKAVHPVAARVLKDKTPRSKAKGS